MNEGEASMPTIKVVGVLLLIAASVAAMAALLMREETELWHLIACGSLGGTVTGFVWRGWRGLLWGVLIGAGIGLISPFVYIPFWLAFTLPPHPAVDL